MKKDIDSDKIDGLFTQANKTAPIMGLDEVRDLVSGGRAVKTPPKGFKFWKLGLGLALMIAIVATFLFTRNTAPEPPAKAHETAANVPAKQEPAAEPKTTEPVAATPAENKKPGKKASGQTTPDNTPAPAPTTPEKTSPPPAKYTGPRKGEYYNPPSSPSEGNNGQWTDNTGATKLKGWYLAGPHANLFNYGPDANEHFSGNASAFIESVKKNYKSAWLTQKINAAAYAGKRVRLTAEIKCDNKGKHPWAGLFLGTIGYTYKNARYDNLFDKHDAKANGWNKCEVVMDIPEDCRFITFGMYKSYEGKAWIDGVAINVVDDTVPVTKKSPVEATDTAVAIGWPKGLTEKVKMFANPTNLDFETGSNTSLKAWYMGDDNDYYFVGADHKTAHGGKTSGEVWAIKSDEKTWNTLMQISGVSKFAGKRVRMTAWVKSENIHNFATLWLRVDDLTNLNQTGCPHNKMFFSNNEWARYEIEIDVPVTANLISYGILLQGKGKIWIDDVSFDVIGSLPDNISKTPVNLDFEE